MYQFVQVTSSQDRKQSSHTKGVPFSPLQWAWFTDEPRLSSIQGPSWVEKYLVSPVFLNHGVTAVFAV